MAYATGYAAGMVRMREMAAEHVFAAGHPKLADEVVRLGAAPGAEGEE